ncbi:serine/threonine-protein kinase [Corynebacterium heidelbergense]|uniref:serine/threonine-protein kinase n=1 Tax=Corynebacterium heidelbergense TaxID=2055947 RepID=UPI003B5C2218
MEPKHPEPIVDPDQPDRTDIDRTQHLLGPRYELSWIIGRGGMSTVWLAFDHEADRDVAVKILKPEYTENPEFRARFRNESEAAEALRSENVVTTYDYGEVRENGAVFCFIVMEYVRGETLADVLRREQVLPEALSLDVMAQTAKGLHAIHEAGMVHRDIKPANLLITPQGVVKVTDFGIAKAAEAVPLTRTGMVVGTAQYVSPEQAQGLRVGPASDIYSLGVVGYEILAGHRPFSGDSSVSVAIKHISEAPQPLPQSVSGPMRELIGICLRKDPSRRFADGEELAQATVFVSRGQRPPRPHLVPAIDIGDQPHTEELAQVATGQGTAVPPRQGPAVPVVPPQLGMPPNSSGRQPTPAPDPRAAQFAHCPPGRAVQHPQPGRPPVAAAAQAAAPTLPRRSGSSSALWIVLVLVSLFAVALVAYLSFGGSTKPSPDGQTTTVTSEVPTTPQETGGNGAGSGSGSGSGGWRPQLPGGADQGGAGNDNGQDNPNTPNGATTAPDRPRLPEIPGLPGLGGNGNSNGNGGGGGNGAGNGGNGTGGAGNNSTQGQGGRPGTGAGGTGGGQGGAGTGQGDRPGTGAGGTGGGQGGAGTGRGSGTGNTANGAGGGAPGASAIAGGGGTTPATQGGRA